MPVVGANVVPQAAGSNCVRSQAQAVGTTTVDVTINIDAVITAQQTVDVEVPVQLQATIALDVQAEVEAADARPQCSSRLRTLYVPTAPVGSSAILGGRTVLLGTRTLTTPQALTAISVTDDADLVSALAIRQVGVANTLLASGFATEVIRGSDRTVYVLDDRGFFRAEPRDPSTEPSRSRRRGGTSTSVRRSW